MQRHAQVHAPRGGTSQCSSKVEDERDETNHGSHNRGMIRMECCKQHRRCMIRSRARPKEVIPEKLNRQRASRAQDTRAFKQQVFDVAVFSVCVSPRPASDTVAVFSVCVSPRNRPKIQK